MSKHDLIERKLRQKLFKEVGAYLSSKRQDKGLKQAEIAKLSGYSSQFVSNVECGTAFPPPKLLVAMIDAYGITEEEFLSTMMDFQLKYYREAYFERDRSARSSGGVRQSVSRNS
jgi:transcriptional regulator with XRE-family HTH domain